MKRNLLILFITILTSTFSFAQDAADDGQQGGKLLERMQQYIQNKLNLSKAESEKFSPIFLRYIAELRKTHRENKGDKILLQSRIADVRLRFRNEFRQVLDEQRANRVFKHQIEFEDKVREEMKTRLQERRQNGGGRRIRVLNPD